MKKLLTFFVFISGIIQTNALVISEVMSNPTGTDDGREWIEIYNNATTSVDLSGLTVSVKQGKDISVYATNGERVLDANSYALIVSNSFALNTFSNEYSSYAGAILKSDKDSFTLVNTGTPLISIKQNGTEVASIPSYTPASEGFTSSLISGAFVKGIPTPGAENQIAPEDSKTASSTTTESQSAIAQMSPPSPDIVLYMPFEKTVVAGADAEFSANGMTRAGKNIDGLNCTWAFGDGGQSTGTSTKYRYAYTGKYIAQVECTNGFVAGVGRMSVRVVAPDINIKNIGTGKYGNYIDIENPNTYDLDLSQWKLLIDGASFPFPKNTMIAGDSLTRMSGMAMGFASTTFASSTVVKISFPNLEEVTRLTLNNTIATELFTSTSTLNISTSTQNTIVKPVAKIIHKQIAVAQIQQATTSDQVVSTINKNKDRRIVVWFKSLFGMGK